MANDQSCQPCGCDIGANYVCLEHKRLAVSKHRGNVFPSPQETDDGYIVKNEGEQRRSPSGTLRNVTDGKVDYLNIIHGPMFTRWAAHLTKAKDIYPDVRIDKPNWTQANTPEDLQRFRVSAFRHFVQWLRGDADEDHAAAVYWNINGAEYTKEQLKAKK